MTHSDYNDAMYLKNKMKRTRIQDEKTEFKIQNGKFQGGHSSGQLELLVLDLELSISSVVRMFFFSRLRMSSFSRRSVVRKTSFSRRSA